MRFRPPTFAAATLACAALAAPLPAAGQDGEPDYSFGILSATPLPPFFLDEPTFLGTVCVQPDGKIVAFGSTEGGQTVYAWRLERDGRIDIEFVFADFWPGASIDPIGAVVLPDGRIFLGAAFSDGGGSRLLTWMMHADGTLDAAYGDGGWRFFDLPIEGETLRAVALGPGGTLLLGSHGFNPSPFVNREVAMITRLLPNGDPDPSWSFSGHRQFEWRTAPDTADESRLGALAPLPDGSLLVAGSLRNSTLGTDHAVIGKIGPEGSFDSGYGTAGRTFFDWSTFFADSRFLFAFGVAPLPDGRAILGASFESPASGTYWVGVARVTALGGADSTFGVGGSNAFVFASGSDAFPSALAADAGGSAVVTGDSYESPSSEYSFGVARIAPDGFPDAHFAGGGVTTYDFDAGGFPDGAQAMALHNDGGILLGGTTQAADHLGGLIQVMAVVRLHGGLPFTEDFETTDFFFWDGP